MLLKQIPAPSTEFRRFTGDTLRFELELSEAVEGAAYVRTNIGRAAVRRREIIRHVEQGKPILECDWHDIPMRRSGPRQWELTLGLGEVGCFAAKAYVLPTASRTPLWPEGANIRIKVEPPRTVGGNTIYTAFVRQFGPKRFHDAASSDTAAAVEVLDAAGYAVIPRSGTFRDLIAELDHIIGTLGFRYLQLLPIHPVPTTYARMGRFGSPFAPLDYLDVDPALAEFDRRTTPLQQFHELLDAVHARGADLLMDIPANHTGWASHLQVMHPEWFARGEDRRFKSPGAWGVTWEDLSELDYGVGRALWQYMADVFVTWCRRGVDGFRCDAGYMVPREVWEYIVARVRDEFPDTIFLLEGLGGPLVVTSALLGQAGLNWAYSEMFQVYDRAQIEACLADSMRRSATRGTYIHFAETHDNNRLAARSPHYARMRTALAALLSDAGGFGLTAGAEWYALEKLDVHGAPPLNWGHSDNQVAWIGRLNALLASHPAFQAGAEVRAIGMPGDNALAVRRSGYEGPALLVLLNLDMEHVSVVRWDSAVFDPGDVSVDRLDCAGLAVRREGGHCRAKLPPGGVACLEEPVGTERSSRGPARRGQEARAAVVAIYHVLQPDAGLEGFDVDREASRYAEDPLAYWRSHVPWGALNLTLWRWPADQDRVVMVPPGHALGLIAPHPFRIDAIEGGASSSARRGRTLARRDSSPVGHEHVVLVLPDDFGLQTDVLRRVRLCSTVYREGRGESGETDLWLLPELIGPIPFRFGIPAREGTARYALCTNGSGAMAQVRERWGVVASQYDALLAANLDPEVPVDRHIMLTRCRAWIVYQGYSHPLTDLCQTGFGQPAQGSVYWEFCVPVGRGRTVGIDVRLTLRRGRNVIDLVFARRPGREPDALPDSEPVRLIVRPDIEDRVNHAKTKAYLGPETSWPAAIRGRSEGFIFAPTSERELDVTMQGAAFTLEPEWHYMAPHPVEAERGQDGASDLFSPGYFALDLSGAERTALSAGARGQGRDAIADEPLTDAPAEAEASVTLASALGRAMDAFIVRRNASRTVIAGYPWFLDWGRDTLIALRGIIAAGRVAEARDILLQFARFEQQGTLPNMIRGNDDSDRDTSDAPLWFLVVCEEFLRAVRDDALLDAECSGRSLRAVLFSIAQHYREGTPNGISMDEASGLIFSPSHFTWMDTNYPAGSPREGYPIEIQALWQRALTFLARLDPDGDWQALAGRVADAIMDRFRYEAAGPGGEVFLSDCLHAERGVPVAAATADDHLRPNQLLALTLGAVTDKPLAQRVLRACELLLVPGAIRSLADRPVVYPLPVEWQGRRLNDPHHPFQRRYTGDEDTSRKPAYHNGTAWTWLFPSYCEALVRVYGEPARATGLALLGSLRETMPVGCVGQIPEIHDGGQPHREKGCGAQAWGVTEAYRVLALLTGNP